MQADRDAGARRRRRLGTSLALYRLGARDALGAADNRTFLPAKEKFGLIPKWKK